MKAVLWYRRDLRSTDHQGLAWAADTNTQLIAIYILEEKDNRRRRRFLIESCLDLKKRLKLIGVPFFVVEGTAEEEIPRWAGAFEAQTVLATAENHARGQAVEHLVRQRLGPIGLELFEQRTLLRKEDLPFSIAQLPKVFTQFRTQVEKQWKLSAETPDTSSLRFLPEWRPPLEFREFDLISPALGNPSHSDFTGGETAAFERLREYLWGTQAVLHYKETRNGMIEKNDSSKFSPWLAAGCLSARQIYWELKRFESQHGANESTYWLVFELLWRDYFKFLAEQQGHNFFSRDGLKSGSRSWLQDHDTFRKWCEGETGEDFVDANMIELKKTGWMSNRGRQNVASYLAKTLGIDWTWGADWFDQHLIDADPESNWGNWLYVSGAGNDPRDRIFNVRRQAELYDPQGAYRRKWLQR